MSCTTNVLCLACSRKPFQREESFSKWEADGWHHCQTVIIVGLLALNQHFQSLQSFLFRFSRWASAISTVGVHLIMASNTLNPWNELYSTKICAKMASYTFDLMLKQLVFQTIIYHAWMAWVRNSCIYLAPWKSTIGSRVRQWVKSTGVFLWEGHRQN